MQNLKQNLPPDFWEPRDCFEPPPPEVHQAIELLDRAANAAIEGDCKLASSLIAQADSLAIFDFVERIWGKVDLYIHRYRDVPGAPPKLKGAKLRMPSKPEQRKIYLRDGWRCRFCGIRVVSPAAFSMLRKAFPLSLRWGDTNTQKHTGFMALRACVDHILPHSRTGTNDPDNLVTTCWPCNFGRLKWTIEEVGLKDPRLRPPIVDSWDGLTRLERHRLI